jgi:transposase
MEVLYARCAGIDVHKRMLMTSARLIADGVVVRELKESGTFTREILELGDWLKERGVTHVAMESTGPYWRPVYNLLEGDFEIVVCNAHHMKNVPGRKTDVKDAQWIADLLAHGFLKPSFVPAAPQRALRDLNRGRSTLVSERCRLSNRIQKLLEESNIKLASVASNVLGVSGRAMLKALCEGESDARVMANLAVGKLKPKVEVLTHALEGNMQPYQRILLRELLRQVESLDSSISVLEKAIHEEVVKEGDIPFESAVALLQTHPGIAVTASSAIIGEIGVDMTRFGSSKRISAWAGVAPGNNKTGGKRISGKTLQGNRALMSILCEVACSAIRMKGSYHSAQYGRIAAKRGKQRAIVAVAHTILVAIYHMLANGEPYRALAQNHFDEINKSKVIKRLSKRANTLGYQMVPKEATAA